MRTDPVTTLVLTAIIAAVAGSVLWAFERTQKPGIPHLRAWAHASLLQAAGIGAVMGLRTILPWQTGIVTGNLLIMSAVLIYGSVIAAYSGRRVRRGFWYVLLLLFTISHSAFLYIWPNLPARMAIFSAFAAVVLLISAVWLFYSRATANGGERFVAFLFGVTGLGMAVRAVAQYPFAASAADSLYSDTGHAGFFHLLALVSNLVNTLGFTVLCIGKYRLDRDKALSEASSQREIFQRQFEMLPVAACIWRIEGNDYVLEQANFAAQVLTEGRIWTQTGGRASQLLARNPEAIQGLNECRDRVNYFVREVPAGFGIRDMQATLSLTFSRISQQHIAVYGESKTTGTTTAG